MKSKHLLSMLLVICMVFSILSPAVNATTAGADSVATGQTAQSAETSATPAEEIEDRSAGTGQFQSRGRRLDCCSLGEEFFPIFAADRCSCMRGGAA